MNKILVVIIAATIIGSMAFMQPTNAQADDCPKSMPPKFCHMIYEEDFWDPKCPMCGYFDVDDPRINHDDYLTVLDARIYQLEKAVLALGDNMPGLSAGDDMTGLADGDVMTGLIVGLVCVSIILSVVSIVKRK